MEIRNLNYHPLVYLSGEFCGPPSAPNVVLIRHSKLNKLSGLGSLPEGHFISHHSLGIVFAIPSKKSPK